MRCAPSAQRLTGQRPTAGADSRPAVVLVYLPAAGNRRALRELAAGLEEEGVPFRLEQADHGTAVHLANRAARTSPLGVGVGVDQAGQICVQVAKRPEHAPALTGPPMLARLLGHNAARLVTGVPLKTSC